MSETAYVNGEFMGLSEATVSVEDRGFQFADGVYEVIVTHGGKPYALDRRMRRLRRSLAELLFEVDIGPEGLGIEKALLEGIERAGFSETFVYIQITLKKCNNLIYMYGGFSSVLTITAAAGPFIFKYEDPITPHAGQLILVGNNLILLNSLKPSRFRSDMRESGMLYDGIKFIGFMG